jgi:hypothetical protein
VVDVGDAVDEPDDLPLERRRLGRARVAEDAVPHLLGQVEPAAAPLEHLDDAERLLVVPEAPLEPFGEHLVERLLARVAERRVAEVVTERDRLGQVLVQLQGARDRSGDPGRLERVREPCPVMVALRIDEDLGLVLEAPERLRVHDAVAVALERRPQAALLLLLVGAPARLVGTHRAGREPGVLLLADASLELFGYASGQVGHLFRHPR